MSDVTRTEPPSPAELYRQAEEEYPDVADNAKRRERFRELMREAGYLVPGKPKHLPCGWGPV